MTLEDVKNKFKAPVVWGNLLGMLGFIVAVIVIMWFGISIYTHHGEELEVPDLTGMSEEDARFALEHVGLVPVVTDSGYNRNLPSGRILYQIPLAGARVKSGREIHLTVNATGCPRLSLPDIADNCDIREAEARLRSMGFKIGPTEYIPGDKDWVLKVKCRGRVVYAGEKIPVDAPIILVVGNTDPETEDMEQDSMFDAERQEEMMLMEDDEAQDW